MPDFKLQYSVICEEDDLNSFRKIIHRFQPGQLADFYVINKWVREGNATDCPSGGYYQVTDLLVDERPQVSSRSQLFRIKQAHVHHNRFRKIKFNRERKYKIRVNLFNAEGELVEEGSIDYPLFIYPA